MSILSSPFPHPLLSLVLMVLWLFLNNSLDPGHLLLGALLGLTIPLFTRRFWPERLVIAQPALILRFAVLVFWDIVLANFAVARIVLGPATAVRPVFVRVPLDVEPDFALTALASVISLTPGTLTADVDRDRRYLLIHALSEDDPAALVRRIKTRYEAPIKEIFAC